MKKVSALVVMATSPVPYEFAPGWIVFSKREFHFDGVRAKVWVSKNGPAGVGFTVRMQNDSSQPQTIEIQADVFCSLLWRRRLPIFEAPFINIKPDV